MLLPFTNVTTISPIACVTIAICLAEAMAFSAETPAGPQAVPDSAAAEQSRLIVTPPDSAIVATQIPTRPDGDDEIAHWTARTAQHPGDAEGWVGLGDILMQRSRDFPDGPFPDRA